MFAYMRPNTIKDATRIPLADYFDFQNEVIRPLTPSWDMFMCIAGCKRV